MSKMIVGLAFLVNLGMSAGAAAADSDGAHGSSDQREIVGQLISIDSQNVYLIKDGKGTEYRLKLAANAHVSKEAVPGKKVEVHVTKDDQITDLELSK